MSDAVLADLYDLGSFARGHAYAQEGRVKLLDSQPGRLRSVVRGSGGRTYVVRVDWQLHGPGVGIADECSCPLGGDCKHVVATLLTARAADPAAARSANWRQALAGIVDDDTAEQARVPLALQIEVTHPSRTRYQAAAAAQVAIRPLRMGKRDKWIKTGVSWRDINYLSYAHRDLVNDHVAVLRAMLASTRSGSYYYPDAAALPLASFGPDIWFHLRRADEAGIALVDARGREGTVEVSSTSAEAALDLTADELGAVTMAVTLTIDGQQLAISHGGLIGDPPHGLFLEAPDGTVRLVPLAAPLHRGLARLLEAPIVVPPTDVDELLDVYQPQLARLASVASSDGSVTITTTELDGLTLFIERTALDAATLEWAARYRRGERVTHHGLHDRSRSASTRDRDAERAAVSALAATGALSPLPGILSSGGEPTTVTVRGSEAITLFTHVVPALRANGVVVEVSTKGGDDLPDLRQATNDPIISLAVSDAGEGPERTDWFDLAVDVSVDGEDIPFAALFTALSEAEPVLVLPSGTWLRLDRPEFARLKELIDEARGLAEPATSGEARINRYQSEWFDELASLGIVTSQSDRWAQSVARMRDLAAPAPVEPPPTLQAKLRPYQRDGLDWLVFLHGNGLGGILADDMGLGKTVQTLALCLHVLAAQPQARFLVVAPTSVVENWHREAARFAPDMTVRTIDSTAARRGTDLAEAIGDATLVVTSYALFRLEFDQYAEHPWELLLLDEAQAVKNHQGKTYQCVRRIAASTKVAITGTPLENSLMDLWSLLSITAPGLYPDPQRFSQVYRKPIERGGASELLATLRRRIAPLMRRRTKAAVLSELPPKIEQTVEIELSARHARIYQTQLQRQRQKVLGLVGDVQRHRFEIFKSLTLLRQLSLDPALVDEAHEAVGSAKIDRLVDDLTEVVAEGHRALVFSQFTRYLARVRARLDAAGIAHVYLDGRTRRRADVISAFKGGDAPVFVISLKAGGVGLNLTEADYCFVLDPWWNPAVETQAVDRAHRIGQTNPVMVYRYVSSGTIEEKVMELKARKAALFSDVMDADGALGGALTEADIRGLLDLS